MDVILVDEQDRPLGSMEKMEVHKQALLHRAFSVFIFNDAGEMLLQKRAAGKYHSAGLWTNACCSHPTPGSDTVEAAAFRLQEEMGFTTPLEKAFDFIYKAPFDNGLTEFEFDHVMIGTYNGPITPNPLEVEEYGFRSIHDIEAMVASQGEVFTVWFKIAFPRVVAHLATASPLVPQEA